MRKVLIPFTMIAVVFATSMLFLPFGKSHRVLFAQSKSKSSVKALDVRAKKAAASFIKEVSDLATSFEKAGELEKARNMLQSVARVGGRTDALQEKIDKLSEEILSANQVDITIDVSRGWGEPIAKVTAGKNFRVQAAGQYRFQVLNNIGPKGFPTEDPSTDMAPGLPCGAVIGMIVNNGRPDRAFLIGDEVEYTPRRSGLLFIRVNVPPGHRCTGKINARLGGYLEAP